MTRAWMTLIKSMETPYALASVQRHCAVPPQEGCGKDTEGT